eukprot:CFRG5676T1
MVTNIATTLAREDAVLAPPPIASLHLGDDTTILNGTMGDGTMDLSVNVMEEEIVRQKCIMDLPREVVVHMCTFFTDTNDLIALASTCNYLRAIVILDGPHWLVCINIKWHGALPAWFNARRVIKPHLNMVRSLNLACRKIVQNECFRPTDYSIKKYPKLLKTLTYSSLRDLAVDWSSNSCFICLHDDQGLTPGRVPLKRETRHYKRLLKLCVPHAVEAVSKQNCQLRFGLDADEFVGLKHATMVCKPRSKRWQQPYFFLDMVLNRCIDVYGTLSGISNEQLREEGRAHINYLGHLAMLLPTGGQGPSVNYSANAQSKYRNEDDYELHRNCNHSSSNANRSSHCAQKPWSSSRTVQTHIKHSSSPCQTQRTRGGKQKLVLLPHHSASAHDVRENENSLVCTDVVEGACGSDLDVNGQEHLTLHTHEVALDKKKPLIVPISRKRTPGGSSLHKGAAAVHTSIYNIGQTGKTGTVRHIKQVSEAGNVQDGRGVAGSSGVNAVPVGRGYNRLSTTVNGSSHTAAIVQVAMDEERTDEAPPRKGTRRWRAIRKAKAIAKQKGGEELVEWLANNDNVTVSTQPSSRENEKLNSSHCANDGSSLDGSSLIEDVRTTETLSKSELADDDHWGKNMQETLRKKWNEGGESSRLPILDFNVNTNTCSPTIGTQFPYTYQQDKNFYGRNTYADNQSYYASHTASPTYVNGAGETAYTHAYTHTRTGLDTNFNTNSNTDHKGSHSNVSDASGIPFFKTKVVDDSEYALARTQEQISPNPQHNLIQYTTQHYDYANSFPSTSLPHRLPIPHTLEHAQTNPSPQIAPTHAGIQSSAVDLANSFPLNVQGEEVRTRTHVGAVGSGRSRSYGRVENVGVDVANENDIEMEVVRLVTDGHGWQNSRPLKWNPDNKDSSRHWEPWQIQEDMQRRVSVEHDALVKPRIREKDRQKSEQWPQIPQWNVNVPEFKPRS